MMARVGGIVAPGDPEFQRILKNPGEFHRRAHAKSDVDSGPEALHHTLGWDRGKAASGGYVRKILIGDWRLLPITASWTATHSFPDNINEAPMYRYVNDFVELRGRCDRADGLTYNTNQTLCTLTDMPEPRLYSGGTPVLTSTSQTASGTNHIAAIQLATSGVITVIPGSGNTAQRWLHLNGIRFDLGQLAKKVF